MHKVFSPQAKYREFMYVGFCTRKFMHTKGIEKRQVEGKKKKERKKKVELQMVAPKDSIDEILEEVEASLTSAMSWRVFGNPLRPHCFNSPNAFIGPRSLPPPPPPLLLLLPLLPFLPLPLPLLLLLPIVVPEEEGLTAGGPLTPPGALDVPVAPVAPAGVGGIEARFGAKSHNVTRSAWRCGRYFAASHSAAPSCSPA